MMAARFGSVLAAIMFTLLAAGSPRAEPQQGFAGSNACAECHAAEAKAWSGSDHAWALKAPDSRNMLGDFTFTGFDRTQWIDCFGSFGQAGSDCDTNKGFTFARVLLAEGASVDVYTLHADADTTIFHVTSAQMAAETPAAEAEGAEAAAPAE